ncbi:unnamed protein product [Amoebophrya sp. A25]|nr:unnamed protein product [Amoebophrya sp. A25]|eukprot:GSA25T00010849001.1
MSRFVWGVRNYEDPHMLSVYKMMLLPPGVTGGIKQDILNLLLLPYVFTTALLAILGGLIMEVYIGRVFVKMANKLWQAALFFLSRGYSRRVIIKGKQYYSTALLTFII